MLTHTKGNAVTVVGDAPNTIVAMDPVKPPALADDAKKHILDHLVIPLMRNFRGGASMDAKERHAQAMQLVEMLTGYEPESFSVGARLMITEREDPFFPTAAEIRKYLTRAEDQHYAAGGQIRKTKRLEQELYTVINGTPWDEKRLGPPIGKPGCRVNDAMLVDALRYSFDRFPDLTDLSEGVRCPEVMRHTALGDPDVGPHVLLRRVRIAARCLGIDLLAYAPCRPLLTDARMPLSAEEIADADEAIAAWESKRYVRILMEDLDKARRGVQDAYVNARTADELGLWRARLEKEIEALSNLNGRDRATWDAIQAAERNAEAIYSERSRLEEEAMAQAARAALAASNPGATTIQ
jgi:hypothetical protein